MSISNTNDEHDTRVEVEASYIPEQSAPQLNRYVFSYTITIHNHGSIATKLMTRHWMITDANGKVEEVHGEGVVGEQPYLKPGNGFRYTSGTIIETPIGSMQGKYHMIADNGTEFDIPIPAFSLAIPNALH